MVEESGAGHSNVAIEAVEKMTVVEARAHARLLLDLGDTVAAGKVLTRTRQRFPECPRTAFLLGTILLDANDGAGLEHLKHAMAQDETATGAVCARAILYLRGIGDRIAAEGYEKRLASWNETADEILTANEQVVEGDRLVCASDEYKNALMATLEPVKSSLSCAYLVGKVMPEWYETSPQWLVVHTAGSGDGVAPSINKSLIEQIVAAGSFEAPRVHILDLETDTAVLAMLRDLHGACLWDLLESTGHESTRAARR